MLSSFHQSAVANSTFNFKSNAVAHLFNVARVGLSIFPVSNRESAGGIDPDLLGEIGYRQPWLTLANNVIPPPSPRTTKIRRKSLLRIGRSESRTSFHDWVGGLTLE